MNNTVKRSISGVCFLAIVISGLLLNKYLFGALLIFMMVTMLYEFYRMTMGDLFPRSRWLAILVGVSAFVMLFCVMAFRWDLRLVSLCAVLLLFLMVSTLFVKDKADFKLFSFLYTGLLYIAVPLALSNFVVFDKAGNFDGRPMLAFLIIIWASDVGAYCVGMLLGKYTGKLFPTVSPKKTWAGFWGGLLFAVLAGLILNWTGLWTYPIRRLRRPVRIPVEACVRHQGLRQHHPRARRHAGPLRQRPVRHSGRCPLPGPHRSALTD